MRPQNLNLAAQIGEDMLVERLTKRIEQPLASLGDTTRQDDGLRIEDGGVVGQPNTQKIACATERLDGHFVTLVTAFGNDTWRQVLNATHQRLFRRTLFHDLPCRHNNATCCTICFQTALLATVTLATMVHDTGMAELTGKTGVAPMSTST